MGMLQSCAGDLKSVHVFISSGGRSTIVATFERRTGLQAKNEKYFPFYIFSQVKFYCHIKILIDAVLSQNFQS